ncbi:molybdate ABC transporter substrate-binding protein, partial [Clostridium sp.]|uniref:molybdate ABC transporter substrate-binding protein n=1 Tax=Clostridium sp. TaxID=1506 RepID=UPI00306EC204
MKTNKLTRVIFSFLMIFSMALFAVGCSPKEAKQPTELTISAAASLKEVMAELTDMYTKENPDIKLTFNFGASGSLQ